MTVSMMRSCEANPHLRRYRWELQRDRFRLQVFCFGAVLGGSCERAAGIVDAVMLSKVAFAVSLNKCMIDRPEPKSTEETDDLVGEEYHFIIMCTDFESYLDQEGFIIPAFVFT